MDDRTVPHRRKRNHGLGFRFRVKKIDERLRRDTTPLCDATPALKAMMHGDVLDHAHLLDVGKRKHN